MRGGAGDRGWDGGTGVLVGLLRRRVDELIAPTEAA